MDKLKNVNLKALQAKLKSSGFFGIIFSSTLIKIIVFASSLFLPRFLTREDFGVYSYSENLFNYFLLLNGLGISNAIMKFCANEESREVHKGYFLTCLRYGLIFDVALAGIIFIFCLIFPFQFEGARNLVMFMMFLPMLLYIFECVQFYLRSEFENNKFSILTFVYSFILLLLQILFVIYFSLNGIIYAKYLSLLFGLALGGYFLYRIEFFKLDFIATSKAKAVQFIKYGIVMLFNNFTSLIISLNDTFFIGSILKSADIVAQYKVASLPLQLMLFFTNAIIIFILPHFIKNASNSEWIRKNFRNTMVINFILCIFIHFMMLLIAQPFVLILYGKDYLDAVPLMYNFLLVSFALSAIRNIPGNLLAVLGYEKYNLKVNVLSVILHIVLSVILLNSMGSSAIGISLFVSYTMSGFISLNKMIKITKK